MLDRMPAQGLYFAYGSNLSRPDWGRYCAKRNLNPAGLAFQRRAWLPDFEVSFRYRSDTRGGGALTIHERVGTAVPGALFEVDDATWEILDAKEGLAQGRYDRISSVALDETGAEHPCITYQVTPAFQTAEPISPAPGYYEGVAAALHEIDLPTDQLDMAAAGRVPTAFPSHLFAYGTLMRNEILWPMLAKRNPGEVIPASCPGRLMDLGEFPGLVNGRQGEEIRGELIPFPSAEAWVNEIDSVEEFLGYGESGSNYRRIIRRASTQNDVFHAWTYLYLGPTTKLHAIRSGDWRKRLP